MDVEVRKDKAGIGQSWESMKQATHKLLDPIYWTNFPAKYYIRSTKFFSPCY